jgi:hypothetical protein
MLPFISLPGDSMLLFISLSGASNITIYIFPGDSHVTIYIFARCFPYYYLYISKVLLMSLFISPHQMVSVQHDIPDSQWCQYNPGAPSVVFWCRVVLDGEPLRALWFFSVYLQLLLQLESAGPRTKFQKFVLYHDIRFVMQVRYFVVLVDNIE